MEDPPLLVICHTVFHDALREYPDKTKYQDSARFLFRYIIEKQSKVDSGLYFSLTTNHVMGRLDEKLPYTQGRPAFPAQMLVMLRNLIMVIPIPAKNQEESVIVISDMLSSRFEGVILVTNMLKMVKHTLKFYQDAETSPRKWKKENIPFTIMTTSKLEELLRKIDPEVCNLIDRYTPNK